MKVWITMYALTRGIFETNGELLNDDMVKTSGGLYQGEGREWHRSLVSARERAIVMRDLELQSLRKQIAKLEKMEF